MLTELAVGSYSIFVVGFGTEGDPVLPSDRSEITTVTIGKLLEHKINSIILTEAMIFIFL